MADKELGLERRRLRGKSKVKIPVAMQDDADANQRDSLAILSQEIAMGSFNKVQEIEEIIDDEEFVL